MAKFLDKVAGRFKQLTTIQTSGGVGDADRVPSLNGQGKLDQTMLPTGIGADLKSMIASEALDAGDWVNVFDDAGTESVRKADAATEGKEEIL